MSDNTDMVAAVRNRAPPKPGSGTFMPVQRLSQLLHIWEDSDPTTNEAMAEAVKAFIRANPSLWEVAKFILAEVPRPTVIIPQSDPVDVPESHVSPAPSPLPPLSTRLSSACTFSPIESPFSVIANASPSDMETYIAELDGQGGRVYNLLHILSFFTNLVASQFPLDGDMIRILGKDVDVSEDIQTVFGSYIGTMTAEQEEMYNTMVNPMKRGPRNNA